MKGAERRQCRSRVTFNFEHISHFFLGFLLFTFLNSKFRCEISIYFAVNSSTLQRQLERYHGRILTYRSTRQRCSVKKVFLEISQNSQENTCARVFFNKVAGLRPEISKNTLFYRTPLVAAS